MVWHCKPWELEAEITSAWLTKMIAFRNSYTLDPDGWNQTAQTNYLQSTAMGSKQAKPSDWIPKYTAAEPQSDEHMERLLRAFANSKRRKKKE